MFNLLNWDYLLIVPFFFSCSDTTFDRSPASLFFNNIFIIIVFPFFLLISENIS